MAGISWEADDRFPFLAHAVRRQESTVRRVAWHRIARWASKLSALKRRVVPGLSGTDHDKWIERTPPCQSCRQFGVRWSRAGKNLGEARIEKWQRLTRRSSMTTPMLRAMGKVELTLEQLAMMQPGVAWLHA